MIVDADKDRENNSAFEIYKISPDLVPCFVSPATARSALFIGKALNHIRHRQFSTTGSQLTSTATELSLFPKHLSYLSALLPQISIATFSNAISAIRPSLSQNALQKLLPFSQVLEALKIFLGHFLLEKGEFAVALIIAANDRLSSRHQRHFTGKASKRMNDLASLTIREGEVQNVLARTWTALAALQPEDDDNADEELDRAREFIILSIKPLDSGTKRKNDDGRSQASQSQFDDFLLPSSSVLRFRIHSPLDLFLTPSDLDTYSQIQAYLLAIRRAHLHLSQLYQLGRSGNFVLCY